MSRQIKIRRGTAVEHNAFTGALGEVTMDTTAKTLRVHDGVTPGGVAMARADGTKDAAFPSNSYVNLTLGSHPASYIAPANGYYMLAIFSGGSEYCNMTNETNGLGAFKSTNLLGQLASFWLPVSQGDLVSLNYTYSGTIVYFRFIYAKGEI